MAEYKPSYEELEAEVERLRREQPAVGQRRRRSWWRALVAAVLIGIACVSLLSLNTALWANRTLLNQDGYMRVVGPLVREPAVQTALVVAAQTQIFNSVDVPALVSEFLPPRAQFLAAPIESQVKNAVHLGLAKVVASPQFEQVWVNVNARAHERLVHVVTTYQGNGQINLDDVYQYLSQRLQDTPLKVLAGKTLPPKFGSIVVINAAWLPVVHNAVIGLQVSIPIAVAVGVLALAGAIWVSVRRRRAVITASVAIILVLCVQVVSVRVTREAALSKIPNADNRAAALAVWQAFVRPLFEQTGVWIGLGLLVVVVAWLTGPYRSAVGVRKNWRRVAGATYRVTGSLGASTPAVGWLRAHRRMVEWALVGLTVLTLMFLTPLTLMTVALAVVILVVLVAVVEIITSAAASKPTA